MMKRSLSVASMVIAGVMPIALNCNVAIAQPSPAPEPPPEANLAKPVDYLDWYFQRQFKPDWPEASEIYPMLFGVDAARIAVPDREDRAFTKAFNRASRGPWTAAELPQIAVYVQNAAPQLAAYLEATETRNVRWNKPEIEPDGWTHVVPAADGPRATARAALAHAWLADPSLPPTAERLVEAARANLAFARHFAPSGASFITQLVAVAIRSTTYETIRHALRHDALDPAGVDRMLQVLLHADGPVSFAESAICEWMSQRSLMQRLYPGGKFSNEFARRFSGDTGIELPGALLPAPEITLRKIDEFWGPLFEVSCEPLSLDAHQRYLSADAGRDEIAGTNLILSITLPALGNGHGLFLRTEAERRATVLLLALHNQRNRNGDWPATLDDIKPAWCRTDPFSGRDFVYELRDGSPVLYCVGFDGEDNGGRHDARYSQRQPGSDFVFFPVQLAD